MEKQTAENEVTFSYSLFWRILRKNWLLLAVIAVVVGIGIGILYSVIYTPEYSSTTQFYVSNISANSEEENPYSNGQTSAAEAMAKYCADYMKGSVVLDAILTEAGIAGRMSSEQLSRMIETKVPSGSAVFTVTVSGADPELIFRISNAVERVLPGYVDYFNRQTSSPAVGSESAMIKLINQSTLDQIPDNRSNLYKYPIVAGVAAFIMGYVLLLVLALADQTVYGKNDFEEKMPHASVFGVIPHWEIEDRTASAKSRHKKRNRRKKKFLRDHIEDRLINLENVPFRISESFQQLCTNITFCSTGKKGCTIGVVSSLANSGKSFIMANLALSLSRLIGKRVLLVDADLRCPMQHRIFRLRNKQGLSNLLAGQASDLTELIHSVSDSLDILTSGTIPPNPMELLSGPSMEVHMEGWKAEYDYILVDLPPVGEVSDAIAVSGLMSGYLFVLRSGLSDVRLVREASAMIESRDAKIFGYALTDVEDEYLEMYSYYSKYSKYSHYAGYRQTGDQLGNADASDTPA